MRSIQLNRTALDQSNAAPSTPTKQRMPATIMEHQTPPPQPSIHASFAPSVTSTMSSTTAAALDGLTASFVPISALSPGVYYVPSKSTNQTSTSSSNVPPKGTLSNAGADIINNRFAPSVFNSISRPSSAGLHAAMNAPHVSAAVRASHLPSSSALMHGLQQSLDLAQSHDNEFGFRVMSHDSPPPPQHAPSQSYQQQSSHSFAAPPAHWSQPVFTEPPRSQSMASHRSGTPTSASASASASRPALFASLDAFNVDDYEAQTAEKLRKLNVHFCLIILSHFWLFCFDFANSIAVTERPKADCGRCSRFGFAGE
jgi:hypothetical protein